jgi:hypothetical protein
VVPGPAGWAGPAVMLEEVGSVVSSPGGFGHGLSLIVAEDGPQT